MKLTLRRATILATGLAMTAACSGGGEEAPVETNVVNYIEPENVVVVENIAAPAPSQTPIGNTTLATPTPTGSEFSDEAQTQDDAEAAGMTARIDRGDDNGAMPAE